MIILFPATAFLILLSGPQSAPVPTPQAGTVQAAPAQAAPPAAQQPAAGAEDAQKEAQKKEAHRKAVEAGRLIERGDLKQAMVLARQAVADDPDNAETHYSLGLCLEAAGNFDEAVAEYKKMGVYTPEPLLELSLARVYLRQGKLNEAEEQARRAVQRNPWVPQPHLSLGAVAMRKRDYKTAIESFSAAIEADPRDWNARISLGDAYRASGRFDEALTQYTQALALKPDHPEALMGRAETWEQLGKWSDAVTAFEKVLQVAPDMTIAQYRLARLYNTVPDPALQKPQRAIELAAKVAEATGWRNPGVLETLAIAYERAGQADKAREIRRQAAQLTPQK